MEQSTSQLVLCWSYTRDSATNLRCSIMRSYYQASVWNQAHSLYPDLPPVTEMGWMHLDGRLVPRILSLPPIPKACREITSCGCTKRCLSQRCMYLLIDRVTWTTCHLLSCVVWSQSLARRSKVVKSPGHLVMGQS